MIRRPPRSTRTDTLFPYTTLFRSCTEVSGTRQRNLHLRKTMPVEMAAQGRQELFGIDADDEADLAMRRRLARDRRSEEHTSELQSLMRISYAVFCLKKKKTHTEYQQHNNT